MTTRRVLPEWTPQWGVMLAWPDAQTDWCDHLDDARACYIDLMRALLDHEHVLLLCRNSIERHAALTLLAASNVTTQRLRIELIDYNDTWARDYGPIAVKHGDDVQLLDYTFTGWGGKFDANKDNAVNQQIDWQVPLIAQSLILEGGAIDTDGNGVLITTGQCLNNPNRNPALNQDELTARLMEQLGVNTIGWFKHGELEGDDTDAHVDTLIRFVDASTLVYQGCDDPNDSHYNDLSAMSEEVHHFAAQHGLTAHALPWPQAQHAADGHRLPATYANFLITNDKIVLPLYGCSSDQRAIEVFQTLAGRRQVVGIDCRVLIEQHGSLHCITMQLPEGVLPPLVKEA